MDQYSSLLKEAQFDILEHWNKQAKRIHWFSSWNTILDWKHPKAQWFKE
jgi:acetyl-CoA synthetase